MGRIADRQDMAESGMTAFEMVPWKDGVSRRLRLILPAMNVQPFQIR
jgi:hypothetical protein